MSLHVCHVAVGVCPLLPQLDLATASGDTALGLALPLASSSPGAREVVSALLSRGAQVGKEGVAALKKAVADGDDVLSTSVSERCVRERSDVSGSQWWRG